MKAGGNLLVVEIHRVEKLQPLHVEIEERSKSLHVLFIRLNAGLPEQKDQGVIFGILRILRPHLVPVATSHRWEPTSVSDETTQIFYLAGVPHVVSNDTHQSDSDGGEGLVPGFVQGPFKVLSGKGRKVVFGPFENRIKIIQQDLLVWYREGIHQFGSLPVAAGLVLGLGRHSKSTMPSIGNPCLIATGQLRHIVVLDTGHVPNQPCNMRLGTCNQFLRGQVFHGVVHDTSGSVEGIGDNASWAIHNSTFLAANRVCHCFWREY